MLLRCSPKLFLSYHEAYAYERYEDIADFFYANDALNPVWTYIGSVVAPNMRMNELSKSFVIPAGSTTQAVRVQFRVFDSYDHANPCHDGLYNDRDDLVFSVSSPSTRTPTPSPTQAPTPSPTTAPSSPSAPKSFHARQHNVCVTANNIQKLSNQTPESCAQSCLDHGVDCIAIEFVYADNGYDNANDCYLSSSIDTSDCDGAHWKTDYYERKSCGCWEASVVAENHEFEVARGFDVSSDSPICTPQETKPDIQNVLGCGDYLSCDALCHDADDLCNRRCRFIFSSSVGGEVSDFRVLCGHVYGIPACCSYYPTDPGCQDKKAASSALLNSFDAPQRSDENGDLELGWGAPKPPANSPTRSPLSRSDWALNSFEYVQYNVCVEGHNIKKIEDTGPLECAQACLDHGVDCVAIEYIYADNGLDEAYTCVLSSSIDTSGCDGAYWKSQYYQRKSCACSAEIVGEENDVLAIQRLRG